MAKTIGNPLSWFAQGVGATGKAVAEGVEQIGGHQVPPDALREIGVRDLRHALRKGVEDAIAMRSDVIFVVVFYPLIGVLLATMASNMALLPLLFPMIAGFALIGPLAAVGLYEMSRKRESGEQPNWGDALGVFRSPSLVPLALLGGALLLLFFFWVGAALLIYNVTLGPQPPASLGTFVSDTFGTAAGWTMILVGVGVGFAFACVALAISVVSFPLLLDRDVGLVNAVVTSVRVARNNPATILTWGAIVAFSLLVGMVPLFLGLIVVMPILGHATWHLYRAAVGGTPEQ